MAGTQCKAWVYTNGGYPTALELSSITPPSKNEVKPNHILVKIHAAALNPVDIQLINLPIWSIPLPLFAAEKTLGSDFAGTVVQGGEGSGFSTGDRVHGVAMRPFAPCGGTLSEFAHLDLASTPVARMKPDWSFQQAAALPCVFLTARTCIDAVAPWLETRTSTKRLVITGGSSACGMYGIQLAKRRGWKVLSTCSGRNVEFVRSQLGADEVVDYTAHSVRDAVKKFKPDAVIDNVGGTECVGLSRRYVSVVGDKTGRRTMGGPLTYYVSFVPRQWIRWAMGRIGLGERYDVISLALKTEFLEEAKEIPGEKIFIDSTFAFDDARQAYERLDTGGREGRSLSMCHDDYNRGNHSNLEKETPILRY